MKMKITSWLSLLLVVVASWFLYFHYTWLAISIIMVLWGYIEIYCYHLRRDENKKEKASSYEKICQSYERLRTLPSSTEYEKRRIFCDEFQALVGRHIDRWPYDYTGEMAKFRSHYAQAMSC